MPNKPYWYIAAERFPKVSRKLQVDVVVVGAGITGVTAAYLLKRAGVKVALVERDRCMRGNTGHTSAHLTCVTDTRLDHLVKVFGRDAAQSVWEAGSTAVEQIAQIVDEVGVDCEFRRVPGFLHMPLKSRGDADNRTEERQLKRETELAREMGFEAEFVQAPLFNRPAMRMANQAKFHPLKYLRGLLAEIPGGGCHVFEESDVTEVMEKPLGVKVGRHVISCGYVVLATHVPLQGKTGTLSAAMFQSKLALYSSYVLAAKVAAGSVPEALFWDTSDPYYYFRADRHRGHDVVIFGGKDHKTGQIDATEARYRAMEAKLRTFLPEAKVVNRWSGQVIDTNDGLPFMGELSAGQFIAPAFAGNGMTFGTVAAMMARDRVVGRENPWSTLFDVHRKKARGGTWKYVRENLDYPYYIVKDWLAPAEGKSVREVRRGAGKILKLNGHRLAVYRDEKGKVTKLSPACTHMGCVVHWNQAERTWDCPCHGSRFRCTGEVLDGPAETPLPRVDEKKGEGKK